MIRVADLETKDRAALLAAWSEVFGSPAPRGISRTFLRRFLAFEIQARRAGGLSKPVVAALKKTNSKAPTRATPPALRPGGRLLHEWNGVTHVIDVTETGFVWKGETWRSLSAIAREITGAHWSGPRFFGLNGKAGSRAGQPSAARSTPGSPPTRVSTRTSTRSTPSTRLRRLHREPAPRGLEYAAGPLR